MGIDVNSIHNIATAMADRERDEANRGKCVNQKGWVTREQARKDAAQKAIAIMALIAILACLWKFLKFLGRLSIQIFGPKVGKIVNIVGFCIILFIPACVIVVGSHDGGMTGSEIMVQQAAEKAAMERKEIEEYKTKVREMIIAEAKERGLDDERLAVVLSTFDSKLYAYTSGSAMSKMERERGVDRAQRECWEDLPAFDQSKKDKYLASEIAKAVATGNAKIYKLKDLNAFEKVREVEYQLMQLKRLEQLSVQGLTFEDAKARIDKEIAVIVEKIDKQ